MPQVYKFQKIPIPQDNIEEFATKLARYGVSLADYQRSFQQHITTPM